MKVYSAEVHLIYFHKYFIFFLYTLPGQRKGSMDGVGFACVLIAVCREAQKLWNNNVLQHLGLD